MGVFFTNPVVSIVVLIGILIFVHEFGHYIVGRMFGFGIQTFSIGFGPKIFGIKRGLTSYQISLLPLGGYVQFVGALPGEPIPPEFEGKELWRFPVWQRALMTFAGPFANLALAFVVFVAVGMNGIKHPPALIGHVRADSPADRAGILPGDRVLKVENQAIRHWNDLLFSVSKAKDQMIPLVVLRDGKELEISLQPELKNDEDQNGKNIKVGRIGVSALVFPNIVAVTPDSIAKKLGFIGGDKIVSLNLSKVEASYQIGNWNQLLTALAQTSQAMQQDSEITATLSVSRLGEKSLGDTQGSSETLQVAPQVPDTDSGKDSVKEPVKDSVKQLAQTINLVMTSKDIAEFAAWKTSRGISGDSESQLVSGRLFAEFLGLRDGSLMMTDVVKDSGLNKGDYLVSMDGKLITDLFELNDRSLENRTEKLTFEVIREGALTKTEVKLKSLELQKPKGKEVAYILPGQVLGAVNPDELFLEKYSGASSLLYGAQRTWKATAGIFGSLVGLFTGQVPLQALGGPMLIAKAAKDSAEAGILVYLTTMAMISINLFLINLFPIPALDGGHLVMQSIEAIRRKPLSVEAMENYQKIGFAFILSLVILSTYNDIGRFWGSFLGGGK